MKEGPSSSTIRQQRTSLFETAKSYLPFVHGDESSGKTDRPHDDGDGNYAKLYALPGAMRFGFRSVSLHQAGCAGNIASMATKLTVPVLAVGGEGSFGSTDAVVMRSAAVNVTELVIPNSGHWLMEEEPAATIAAIRAFLMSKYEAHRRKPTRLLPECMETTL